MRKYSNILVDTAVGCTFSSPRSEKVGSDHRTLLSASTTSELSKITCKYLTIVQMDIKNCVFARPTFHTDVEGFDRFCLQVYV